MWKSTSGCSLQLQLHSLRHCSLLFPHLLEMRRSVEPSILLPVPPSSTEYFCLASLSHLFSLHLSAARGCYLPAPSFPGMLLEHGLTLPRPKSPKKGNGQQKSVHSKGRVQAPNASVDGTAPHFCRGAQEILQVC